MKEKTSLFCNPIFAFVLSLFMFLTTGICFHSNNTKKNWNSGNKNSFNYSSTIINFFYLFFLFFTCIESKAIIFCICTQKRTFNTQNEKQIEELQWTSETKILKNEWTNNNNINKIWTDKKINKSTFFAYGKNGFRIILLLGVSRSHMFMYKMLWLGMCFLGWISNRIITHLNIFLMESLVRPKYTPFKHKKKFTIAVNDS